MLKLLPEHGFKHTVKHNIGNRENTWYYKCCTTYNTSSAMKCYIQNILEAWLRFNKDCLNMPRRRGYSPTHRH